MKISVIATTKPNYIATKEEFDNFGGKAAGVCYMPSSFEDLLNEDAAKTERRINQTKTSQHHSVYDHEQVSLYLENIPKALAMMINNEKMYSTSEKSARYTKMVLTEGEQLLYDKWLNIFKEAISKAYQEKYPELFNDKKIEKLAQENARYLISVFTPTSMIYTTSYRQINVLYDFMQKFIAMEDKNKFEEMLEPAVKDFCEAIEKTPYLDEQLINNNKNRSFSLLNKSTIPVEYFGDVYATTYKGSFAQLAQAQRHRTIAYKMQLLAKPEFYVPPIIRSNAELIKQWEKDCEAQAHVFPQGMLVNISELGTMENFILKMKERKCTFAQLEINQQTDATLKKYVEGLEKIKHPSAEELKLYTRGSRCTFPDYKCASPCGFLEGIQGEREI